MERRSGGLEPVQITEHIDVTDADGDSKGDLESREETYESEQREGEYLGGDVDGYAHHAAGHVGHLGQGCDGRYAI